MEEHLFLLANFFRFQSEQLHICAHQAAGSNSTKSDKHFLKSTDHHNLRQHGRVGANNSTFAPETLQHIQSLFHRIKEGGGVKMIKEDTVYFGCLKPSRESLFQLS